MIKLSLVVPMYGVEKYIHKFLNSVERNLQFGVEVLIINDGTKDNSAEIAEQFSSKYPDYIKVINKENGGVSSARNKGIELAKGEYIIFPDSDDYLADDYVGTILNAIDKYNKPDMIFFDFYQGCDTKGFKRKTVPNLKEGIVPKERFVREYVRYINIQGVVWCKAIKRALIKGLRFDINTRLSEDDQFMTDLVLRLEKIVYIPKALYYYVNREGSLSHTCTLKELLKAYDMTLGKQTKYSKLYDGLSIYRLVRRALNILLRAYAGEKVEKIDRYENVINENIKSIILSSDFDINDKKQCLLVYFGFAKAYYGKKHKQ